MTDTEAKDRLRISFARLQRLERQRVSLHRLRIRAGTRQGQHKPEDVDEVVKKKMSGLKVDMLAANNCGVHGVFEQEHNC